jgi:Hemerythrin HHE cation binding domain
VPTSSEALHAEHEQLAPDIDAIREAADLIGDATTPRILEAIDGVLDFLRHRLIPMAIAKGRTLSPVLRQTEGGLERALQLQKCHVEISTLTDRLSVRRAAIAEDSELTRDQTLELRRLLYGIYTLICAHLKEEEDAYGTLEPAAVAETLGAMRAAEETIRTMCEPNLHGS